MLKIDENYWIWPAHEAETKIPEKFLNNPWIENKGKSRSKNSQDPGILQNPGIENLYPARDWAEHQSFAQLYNV